MSRNMSVAADPTAGEMLPVDVGGASVWVVPHTHWDREWYLPFQQLRVHLARMMDDLLDVLDQSTTMVFTLDGQAVMIEDYLELCPEQEDRLRAHIASGRIAVGPSYVLPDEFLAGQESLVRNLLMGRQVCARYGGRPMAVGYAPDTFGHVAQLPQILRGFGIDCFVFWRGLGDEADHLGAVFWWQGPEGSRVLAARLLEGYANARDLGRWTRGNGWLTDTRHRAAPEAAARRIAEFIQRWLPAVRKSGLRDFLLGNGADHQWIQRDLPEILAACQPHFPVTTLKIGTYEGFVETIRGRLGGLQTHSGELVGGKEACVVRGVNSSRMYLKQANEATERLLLVAETLASLAHLRGGLVGATSGPLVPARGPEDGNGQARGEVRGPKPPPTPPARYPYPLNELRLAWRELLRNTPHDSLPGCSVDEVHRDMEQRFRSAQQIAQLIQREALEALGAQALRTDLRDVFLEAHSVVNPLPWSRVGVVEIDLPDAVHSGARLLALSEGGALPVQLLDSRRGQCRALVALCVAGFGARQVWLCRGEAPSPSNGARVCGPRAIENEYYRVEVSPNGSLSITDHLSGQHWDGFHWFEDDADRGDEYSFCPVEGDTPVDSRGLQARVRVLARGPVVAELEVALAPRLPRELRADRKARARSAVASPIRTAVRLAAGVDRIEFRTSVVNRARDHRLRVRFRAPGSGRFVRAEGHFAVVRRPAEPVWNGQWREPPARTHHTSGMVAAGKLVLMSRGLPEYEAIPNRDGGVDLALTLLRCVGWLSWPDLATRPHAEEPHIPTPEAQCLGTHTFEYALSLRGERDDVALVRASQDYRVGLVSGPPGADPGGALSVDGEGFAFAALKGAEVGRGVMLRLYNPGDSPSEVRVGGRDVAVRRCRLDETPLGPEEVETITLRGGEIATLWIATRHSTKGL